MLSKEAARAAKAFALLSKSSSIAKSVNCKVAKAVLPETRFIRSFDSTRTRKINVRALAILPHYAGLEIDRCGALRKQPEKIAQLAVRDDARLVLLQGYSGLLIPRSQSQEDGVTPKYKLVTVPAKAIPDGSVDQRVGKVFLGLNSDQQPLFAAAISRQAADSVAAIEEKAEWVELRREGGPNLAPDEAALAAYAAGMVNWARKHLYSSVSGQELLPVQAGHARAAENERAIFTRIDPAVIMAVTFGDWILLGRQSQWSKGRFSLLAGFCEVGETLEQAVVRETLEEARVSVELGSVRYHSSQPWPFPQSLMIGFTAKAVRESHAGAPLQKNWNASSPNKSSGWITKLCPAQCWHVWRYEEAQIHSFRLMLYESRQKMLHLITNGLFHDNTSFLLSERSSFSLSRTASRRVKGTGAEIAQQKGITAEEVQQIMGGTPRQANPADDELEAAFWFHRSFVADSLKGLLPAGVDFAIPGPHALANRIITGWAEARSDSGKAAWKGQDVPDVVIDVGRFKYILLRLFVRNAAGSKLIVRGDRGKAYHADILEAVQDELNAVGLQVEVLGGGRIENSIQEIKVFGFSTAFGAAPHELTAALLRREYPMASFQTSYAGY